MSPHFRTVARPSRTVDAGAGPPATVAAHSAALRDRSRAQKCRGRSTAWRQPVVVDHGGPLVAAGNTGGAHIGRTSRLTSRDKKPRYLVRRANSFLSRSAALPSGSSFKVSVAGSNRAVTDRASSSLTPCALFTMCSSAIRWWAPYFFCCSAVMLSLDLCRQQSRQMPLLTIATSRAPARARSSKWKSWSEAVRASRGLEAAL